VVCLDVVGDLLPSVGLECFFTQKRGLDPRWAPLLKRLAALGVSAPEKAETLLAWPGSITPPEASAPWPDDLIAQSLTQPAGRFGMIERRLSHVKLTWAAGKPVSAKAYFGFVHVWADSANPPARAHDPPTARPAISEPLTRRAAIDAAIDLLLGARNQGGWWRDFFDRGRPAHMDGPLMGSTSDEWVTAYIGAALATVADPRATAAAAHAFDLLLTRRQETSGWGYHAAIPPDADTTTYVLRLARRLGAPEGDRLSSARRFVTSLIGPSGGVSTYGRDASRPLAEFFRVEGSYDGWCAAHTCVTAAAATLDFGPHLLEYLRRAQRTDGSWSGHWWDDDEYTTARATEALAPHDEHRGAMRSAVTWAMGRIRADGAVWSRAHAGESAFATALALQVVLTDRTPGEAERKAVARAERWLISQQRADGSWEPSARLRIPAIGMIDPLASPDTTFTYVDDEALFTTATVLAALSAVAATMSTPTR
jgi:squalene-hopene/tetraprenyl-beta-curcumene cyclase